MSYQLTSGALRRAFLTGECSGGPTVQILEVRAIKGQERYRLVLNDGEFYQQGMLTTQLNHLVSSGQLKEGTVVKLQEFLCSQVSTRKVIIVLNMTVVGHTQPIGAPQNVEMLQLGAAGNERKRKRPWLDLFSSSPSSLSYSSPRPSPLPPRPLPLSTGSTVGRR
jgi:hypothetical protein